ncbi:ferric-dicitrate binding protein FerR (iron transport regulator) [Arcicella rosea]|uniref:FecR family protein n=1 Tax=Arcicella rosea TaxID=502909 RepID=UPI00345DCC77
MNTSITKYIVFEYLSGRATALENQAVEEWLCTPENIEIFHEWLLEWELRSPQFTPNTQGAFHKLINKMDSSVSDDSQMVIPSKQSKTNTFSSILAIAASVLVIIGSVWLMKDYILFKTYKTNYAEVSSFLLEDGSHVSLNANSILKVPRWGFDNGVREVTLQGEAEFSVTHTFDNKRFIVKTSDQFQIEVLGTEFSVFARKRGTKVVLNRGKIRIDYASGSKIEQLLMKPGDLVTLNQQGKIALEKTPEPQAYSAWKTQRFVFNGTSVREIVALLNENFGVEYIILNEEIASRTISGTFKAQSADELLQVFSEVLSLKIIETEQGKVLTNK